MSRRTRLALKIVRVWLPAAVVLGGILSWAVQPSMDNLIGAAHVVGAGLAIWLLNLLTRIGFSGDRDRRAEEDARAYFDRHGYWPGEGPEDEPPPLDPPPPAPSRPPVHHRPKPSPAARHRPAPSGHGHRARPRGES